MTVSAALRNACPRCLLRLQNNRTAKHYQSPQPHPPNPPCPLCFNILHDSTLLNISQSLPSHLSTITHDSRFKINATIPLTLSLLRPHLISLVTPHEPAPVSLREALKWSLSPLISTHTTLVYHPDSPLFLDLSFQHPSCTLDLQPLNSHLSSPPRKKHRPRSHHTHTPSPPTPVKQPSLPVLTNLLQTLPADTLRSLYTPSLLPSFPSPSHPATWSLQLSVAPLLLAGSYNKLSRLMSQTPWYVDPPSHPPHSVPSTSPHDVHARHKRTALSVEDVVVQGIRKVLQPHAVTFTAGGREDVDVRMLGRGRPFVVEVLNSNVVPQKVTPQMVATMVDVSHAMASAVVINGLRVVDRPYFAKMKAFETEKRKCYRCVVWTGKELEEEDLRAALEVDGGVLLKQKTPLRVLHRRTQAVRERQIWQLKVVRLVEKRVFVLDVVAAAGTYIKEFVHGDNGRTVPNVATMLGCEADILQLDVLDIYGVDTANGIVNDG